MFALQFARMSGARSIVTSSSAAKLERARALGASECIDCVQTPDWAARVLALTDGLGVDHVVDVGGPASFSHSLRALRSGGHISVIGYLGGMQGEINPLQLLERQARLSGLQVGPRTCFEAMNRALALSRVHPVVDSVFGWSELPAALRRLRSAEHVGKIVLVF
jgi:NADPH:quinone reductase-like Zn-dependent oxidoreductase